MDPELKDTSTDESASIFSYNHAEVDQDLSYLTAFDDEVTGLQHYLPECNMDCFDETIGFETFNSVKCFNVDTYTCAFKYDQIKFDGDALDLYLAQEGEETKVEGDGNRLQVTNENILIGDFSLHSTCGETMLDAEPVDKVSNLNYGAWAKSCLGNMDLESHSSNFQERDCHTEKSDLSFSRVMVLESAQDKDHLLLEKMTAQDLRQVFSRIFGRETSVMDEQWLKHRIIFGLQNRGELLDGLNSLECGKTSKVDEGKAILLSSTASSGIAPNSTDILGDQLMSEEKHVKREMLDGCNSLKSVSSPVREVGFCSFDGSYTSNVLVTQKRTHRPTRTSTRGLEEKNSRNQHRKCGAFYENARDEFLHVRSHKHHHQKGLGAIQMNCQEESLTGCLQAPFSLPVQIGQSTKSTSLVNIFDNSNDYEASVSNEEFDRETSSADSQDDISDSNCVTTRKRGRKRRQRHRRWTPCEVMKLIEGVSKCGVGKWTHIKKLLFSSSSHRTSVNLKDKWRNLLKASSNEMQKKRKVEQEQTHASHQLPESIWHQIRELAVIYSYPRESKSKVSCTSLASSTTSNYC